MLTDQDMDRMKAVFVTKEESKSFATKADLRTEIKKELKRELKNLVTKEEHNRHYNYLVANMATKADLARLEKRFDRYDEKFDHVMTTVDRLMVPLSVLREEYAASTVQYQRQVEWNHKVAEKVGIPFDY